MEYVTLIAVFVGPIAAVMVSQLIEKKKQLYNGKVWVFKTLMRTRATTLSPSHVEALNMIDVEFYGTAKKDKDVVSAWKLYLDNLGDKTTSEEIRNSKRSDLFLELLHKMAIALNYDFDKQHIKNTSYLPQGYVDAETEQHHIRKGVLSALRGDTSIPMHVTNLNSQGNSGDEKV